MTQALRRNEAVGHPGLVLGGQAVPGEAGTYPVHNPARPSEVVLEAPAASPAQLDQAVALARQAQPAWAAVPFDERLEALEAALAAMAQAVEGQRLDRLLCREHGKVLAEATFDMGTLGAMAGAFAPFAKAALSPQMVASGSPRTEVLAVPAGVVAAVLPFNWPVSVLGNKLLPALLTGNAVVVKPPPTCPGALLEAAAALAGALPAGLVNVVNGPDPALGAAVVGHEGVDMVSFTGGVPTGRAVLAGAAARVRPVVVELGGNDPAVIGPDVEITEELADRLVSAAFVTSGQVCMAIKRVYAPAAAVGALVEALVARTAREVVGDGLEPEVTMGPVHQPDAQRRVEAMVAEAEALGARVQRPATRHDSADPEGYFVSPAIVEDPPPHARIVVEEQFAPALPVLGYRRVEDALAQANDSPYGLCASVWTADEELASTAVARLEAGTVFVNTHGITSMDPRAPFGGWKESGLGVELGPEGMAAFTRRKTVLAHPPLGAP